MKNISVLHTAGFVKKGFAKGFLLGLLFLVLGIASSIVSNPGLDPTQLAAPEFGRILMFTTSMFMVGAAEEIVFRGLLLGNMVKKWGGSKKGVIKAASVSALIFGGIHLLNAVVAPFGTVVVQTINAACAGVLFSVIYLRSKNIWSVMIVHMLVDWLALFVQQCFAGTTSIVTNELSLLQGLLIVLAGSAVPLIFSVVYMRNYELPNP